MIKWFIYAFFSLAFALGTLGCESRLKSPFAQNLASRDWTPDQESPPERAYCTTVAAYSGETIQVTGQAGYQYRETILDPGDEGLGDVSATARPIRHAQYEVVNGAGTVLQCGETDENGSFNFVVQEQERTLTLKIYSRSNNIFNRASVFRAPETNELYSLDYSFFADQNQNNVNIVAEAKGTVLGGAFFILDQIHITYDRLQELLLGGTGFGSPINSIPKADIYWEAGFNPGVYVGVESGLSFFTRQQQKIFILGGDNGEVNFSDTDHFDPAIIIHEYFHFLENTVGSTNSPGGAHNGNEVLDPRLAWSEGAAQFFQAVITELPSVIDTRGNIDGSTGLLVKFGLESDINDLPNTMGEGDYREFAISRFLWDMHDDEDSQDAPEDAFDLLEGRFRDFWEAVTNISNAGLNSSSASFRSMGLFLEAVSSNGRIPTDDPAVDNEPFDNTWKLLLDRERLLYPAADQNNSFRGAYGIPTVYSGSSTDDFLMEAPFSTPAPDISITNPIRNINFHSVILNQTVNVSLNVGTNGSSSGGDLEFYIYSENYVGLSSFVAQGSSSSVVTVPPGDYLIAVVVRSVFTPNGTNPATAFVYSLPGFIQGSLQ